MSIVTGLLHHARSGGVAVAAEVAVNSYFRANSVIAKPLLNS
jgi:hypothetical protein